MRIEPTSKAAPPSFPRERAESRSGGTTAGDGQSFDWEALVPHVIHPLKVAIIEALSWIDQPLSPTQMVGLFEGSGYYLSLISFHARGLEDWGALEVAITRPVRGATEISFFFSTKYGSLETGDGAGAGRRQTSRVGG